VNRKLAEYESRLALLSQELERLTGALKAASQENEGLRRQLSEMQAHSSNYEMKITQKVTAYETNLSFLQNANEELQKRLQ
jgi:predicted  nucleic acid-binding Zn-ribbon protein